MEWPKNLPKSPTHPSVSLLTPTYNRRRFIPWLIECVRAQTYPKERMEWVIFDDGTDSIEDIITPFIKELNIRYFRSEEKLNIGGKRNRLHKEARAAVCVALDDDDYYPPERVAHAVNVLVSKKVDVCGSTRNHLYYTDNGEIWETGPYGPNHATFGTMAYTRSYALKNPCDETLKFAEESKFLCDYKTPLAQLDPLKVMLVMCHSENTFSKHKLRESPNQFIRKTGMKIKSMVRNPKLREFYSKA